MELLKAIGSAILVLTLIAVPCIIIRIKGGFTQEDIARHDPGGDSGDLFF